MASQRQAGTYVITNVEITDFFPTLLFFFIHLCSVPLNFFSHKSLDSVFANGKGLTYFKYALFIRFEECLEEFI